jgi:hypothetical protein
VRLSIKQIIDWTLTRRSMPESEMNSPSEDHEEAIMRRRFDEWTIKGIALLIPAVLSISGWAFTLQGRIHEIAAQQAERGPRIVAIEQKLSTLLDIARDPAPKPETKVEMQAMKEQINRLDERVNNLHNYILALPVRPGPYSAPPSKRGDLKLDEFIEKRL